MLTLMQEASLLLYDHRMKQELLWYYCSLLSQTQMQMQMTQRSCSILGTEVTNYDLYRALVEVASCLASASEWYVLYSVIYTVWYVECWLIEILIHTCSHEY